MKNIFFNTPVKGKVIIAFTIACIALALAWNISKYTFSEMLQTVEDLSAPNEKLTIVSHLSGRVTRMDQLQRTMAIDKKTYQGTFIKEFSKLGLTLDTLGRLYKDNPTQVKHINSLRQLLSQRNKLFLDYLHIREQLVNNDELAYQLESLNGILSDKINKKDSATVHTTQKKVSTTTVLPVEREAQKGFFSRLFGKKKSQEKVINEELAITIDTITPAGQDYTLKTVKQAVLSMEKKQHQQSEKFVNRETQLALASNNLTNQMLSILQQVEEDAMNQSALNNLRAQKVVGLSVKYINIILVTFLFLTAVLMFFILTDISRSNAYRKQLEIAKDEAEYHSSAKQRFLANMSHEIRTPLQAIIGYTDLLKKGKHSDHTIDAIYHSSTHLSQIVNEVLDYSRIISGKLSFDNTVFNLTELLKEVVSVMRLSAHERSLELHTEFDLPPSEHLNGDAFRLKQILYNLLSNAIKFTDKGKITLRVSSKRHNGSAFLMFSVEDTGIGIAGEDLNRVFNEFDQGSSSDKQISSGSGLGLSIVKAITEGLGGRIYVKSKKGQGSCFTLYLRFELTESQAFRQPLNVQSTPLLKGKVWVVDDDAFILQLCSSLLENHKISHVCFDAPEKILDAPWDEEVCCILLDIRMPRMNGAELCAILRSKIPAQVKIYAVTAQVLPEERAWVMSQGFDGLLMKPFREEELLNLLRSGNYHQETENRWNIEALQKMTFGDELQLKKVVGRFIVDSEEDIRLLTVAEEKQDKNQLSLVLHRIAGRTAQMGAKELALAFRKLEIDSQNGILRQQEMRDQLNELAELINVIDIEMKAGTLTQHA
ncbi:ATP-binding protein [Paradesertivirga mongoliensis]|uniref:histidine kinase n=1 Tax=Paradesertivirga mongoliensis TaxID=2100740 RepID=A0ABW4ZHJ4_9SPHI|nr:ATP-binding protein [Pedobacter mongoliensis]